MLFYYLIYIFPYWWNKILSVTVIPVLRNFITKTVSTLSILVLTFPKLYEMFMHCLYTLFIASWAFMRDLLLSIVIFVYKTYCNLRFTIKNACINLKEWFIIIYKFISEYIYETAISQGLLHIHAFKIWVSKISLCVYYFIKNVINIIFKYCLRIYYFIYKQIKEKLTVAYLYNVSRRIILNCFIVRTCKKYWNRSKKFYYELRECVIFFKDYRPMKLRRFYNRIDSFVMKLRYTWYMAPYWWKWAVHTLFLPDLKDFITKAIPVLSMIVVTFSHFWHTIGLAVYMLYKVIIINTYELYIYINEWLRVKYPIWLNYMFVTCSNCKKQIYRCFIMACIFIMDRLLHCYNYICHSIYMFIITKRNNIIKLYTGVYNLIYKFIDIFILQYILLCSKKVVLYINKIYKYIYIFSKSIKNKFK